MIPGGGDGGVSGVMGGPRDDENNLPNPHLSPTIAPT